MEDTLGVSQQVIDFIGSKSLNPCFNGRYSRSKQWTETYGNEIKVLILVLMEDTLGVTAATADEEETES